MINDLTNYCYLATAIDDGLDLGKFLVPRLSKNPSPNHLLIVSYMRESSTLDEDVMFGFSVDYFDESKFIGPRKLYTDGVWIWSTDIIYYVEKYFLKLPSEFLSEMKKLNWQTTTLSQAQKQALIEKYQNDDSINYIV